MVNMTAISRRTCDPGSGNALSGALISTGNGTVELRPYSLEILNQNAVSLTSTVQKIIKKRLKNPMLDIYNFYIH
jgi:phosphoribosylformylglycinamidine (FGAM) synthase PurS component